MNIIHKPKQSISFITTVSFIVKHFLHAGIKGMSVDEERKIGFSKEKIVYDMGI